MNQQRNATQKATFQGAVFNVQYFVQQLVNGLTLGAIYGLIAIGYTMVYGIIGMINFAHGDIFMVGAFIALIVFLILTSVSPASMWCCFVDHDGRAMVMTSLTTGPSKRSPTAARLFPPGPLITAIGMSIFLSNFVQVTQGPRNKPIPPLINQVYTVGGISISLKQIVIVVTHSAARHILVSGQQDGARPRPTRRIARWRRCSAWTSTRPSRSPSSWARLSLPSPVRCS
jgi:branched-subunit amino acid ABC-type transport system permease component